MAVPEPTVLLGANQVMSDSEEEEVCDDGEDEDEGMDSDYEVCFEGETGADSSRNTNMHRGVKRRRCCRQRAASQKLSAQALATGRARVCLSEPLLRGVAVESRADGRFLVCGTAGEG